MKINILTDKVPWFGKYSGYECLPSYLPEKCINRTFNASERTRVKRVLGKYYQFVTGVKEASTSQLYTGVKLLNSLKDSSGSHILYFDNHVHLLSLVNEHQSRNMVGTIHLPLSQWHRDKLEKLSKLRNAIVLYESEMDKFQEHMPGSKLKFIRHGVENSFFRPGVVKRDMKKILCVGHYLRNFEMLERVITRLSKSDKALTYHLVIPKLYRNLPALSRLSRLESVFFYEKLSDEDLLLLYQECGVMVMPMEDSGANTAIVQGIACGIPIITTNNGGISSYGGGTVFPVVENNDDLAMVELVSTYMYNEALHEACSIDLRKFSLECLDWSCIAQQHLDYYESVIAN